MPQPKGWQQYSNPNFAPGTQVIAKGDTYPTAMLVVLKLNGDFDVNEAIKHGYADAELSQNFKRLNASTDNWHGFPVVDDRGQLRPQRPADAQLQPHRHRHRRRRRRISATSCSSR